jgi:nucleotide-binding universal stress UspA family protein
VLLVEEVHEDDLLVVGSRGLGAFKALLLGSVSLECARHAPCPVVIHRRREG